MCCIWVHQAACKQEGTYWSCVHQDFLHMCSTHLLVYGCVSRECSTLEFGQHVCSTFVRGTTLFPVYPWSDICSHLSCYCVVVHNVLASSVRLTFPLAVSLSSTCTWIQSIDFFVGGRKRSSTDAGTSGSRRKKLASTSGDEPGWVDLTCMCRQGCTC